MPAPIPPKPATEPNQRSRENNRLGRVCTLLIHVWEAEEHHRDGGQCGGGGVCDRGPAGRCTYTSMPKRITDLRARLVLQAARRFRCPDTQPPNRLPASAAT